MANTSPLTLVFMLEEASASNFLKSILPRIIPASVVVHRFAHSGKKDLEQSLPIKMNAWLVPNSFFVVLYDLDNHSNCVALKKELKNKCANNRGHTPLICIVCQELESWYLGDLSAVKKAFPKFNLVHYKTMAKFRNPDNIVKPSQVLTGMLDEFSKGLAARNVPQYMDIENNRSPSFNHMVTGVKNLVQSHLNTQKNLV